ncbi:MAG: FkbM family methyltransferase [Planctomycetes bacterium]|nr:FkbM family methyltransferase [Planctomycetota bacterium]
MSVKLRYLYRAYRYRLRVDPAELRFVCSQLQPGQVAADIGCHKGAYTYWMRRRVGFKGAVFAFEPQPRQVDYLRLAFTAMRYDNVAIVPMAVSNTCGQLTLHVPHGAGETHAATLEAWGRGQGEGRLKNSMLRAPCTMPVEVTTIDAFFAKNRGPSFLKIDVEGHELAVLDGARHTLESHRPALLIECEARHRSDGDVRPVFELLRSHGYEGSFFLNGRRHPLAEFDSARHQRIDSRATSTPRGYVNNFAFVHDQTW